MKELTRDRVVPIMSASVSCVIGGIRVFGSPGLPDFGHQEKKPRRQHPLFFSKCRTAELFCSAALSHVYLLLVVAAPVGFTTVRTAAISVRRTATAVRGPFASWS